MIAIVDYGLGNLGSIVNMLKKIGAPAVRTSDPAIIGDATKLVLPGVGAFGHGMQRLQELGLIDVLNVRVREKGIPILGLCLGMQLFSNGSEEGTGPGLGWIEAETRRFAFGSSPEAPRVPHIGWNTVTPSRTVCLFRDMAEPPRFYFVHSYHLVCADPCLVAARTNYGYDFCSAIQRDNILGVQFHPEKSHKFGMQLFRNFVQSRAS
jgi:glutamine amidotransferase